MISTEIILVVFTGVTGLMAVSLWIAIGRMKSLEKEIRDIVAGVRDYLEYVTCEEAEKSEEEEKNVLSVMRWEKQEENRNNLIQSVLREYFP